MSESQGGIYTVEEIQDHRQVNSLQDNIELKIKWEGYDQVSWEPISNMFEDIPDMVNTYFESRGLKAIKVSNGKYSVRKKSSKNTPKQRSNNASRNGSRHHSRKNSPENSRSKNVTPRNQQKQIDKNKKQAPTQNVVFNTSQFTKNNQKENKQQNNFQVNQNIFNEQPQVKPPRIGYQEYLKQQQMKQKPNDKRDDNHPWQEEKGSGKKYYEEEKINVIKTIEPIQLPPKSPLLKPQQKQQQQPHPFFETKRDQNNHNSPQYQQQKPQKNFLNLQQNNNKPHKNNHENNHSNNHHQSKGNHNPFIATQNHKQNQNQQVNNNLPLYKQQNLQQKFQQQLILQNEKQNQSQVSTMSTGEKQQLINSSGNNSGGESSSEIQIITHKRNLKPQQDTIMEDEQANILQKMMNHEQNKPLLQQIAQNPMDETDRSEKRKSQLQEQQKMTLWNPITDKNGNEEDAQILFGGQNKPTTNIQQLLPQQTNPSSSIEILNLQQNNQAPPPQQQVTPVFQYMTISEDELQSLFYHNNSEYRAGNPFQWSDPDQPEKIVAINEEDGNIYYLMIWQQNRGKEYLVPSWIPDFMVKFMYQKELNDFNEMLFTGRLQ